MVAEPLGLDIDSDTQNRVYRSSPDDTGPSPKATEERYGESVI